MKIANWSSLRRLGASRLLQTSYLWFILVPILVKLTTSVSSGDGIVMGGYRLSLGFDLPFSWELFFYSAVFASLANLIYLWKCPAIIKHFSSYSHFKEQGKTSEQLRKEFEVLLLHHKDRIKPSDLKQNIEEYLSSFCKAAASSPDPEGILKNPGLAVPIVSSREIKPEKTAEAFWFVHDFAENLNKVYRFLCFSCYVVCLFLIVFVSAQNVLFVVRYSINTHIGR